MEFESYLIEVGLRANEYIDYDDRRILYHNIPYFRKCHKTGLSPYKALLFFSDLGHNHVWKYNFSTMPNKRICVICSEKEAVNKDLTEWSETFTDKRSNQELKEKWTYEIKY